jgi:tRNA(Leu) C34 or U34 (ribose-2'-O)-methylase TrmL
MTVAVMLDSPKFAHNVGNALRAGALLGAEYLFWTGDRVKPPEDWDEGERLPREERMRCYRRTRMMHMDDAIRPVLRTVQLVADMVEHARG